MILFWDGSYVVGGVGVALVFSGYLQVDAEPTSLYPLPSSHAVIRPYDSVLEHRTSRVAAVGPYTVIRETRPLPDGPRRQIY